MNKRKVGEEFEKRAAEYLVKKGHRILKTNYRNRVGEIDIISYDNAGACLVFTEVKYRKSSRAGDPLEAVNIAKQRRISHVAAFYIMKNYNYADVRSRFDVISITPDAIVHIENAFEFAL